MRVPSILQGLPDDLLTSYVVEKRLVKVYSEDYLSLISKGQIAGHKMLYVNSNAEIIGATEKLIWPFDSAYVYNDTPATLYLSSTSAGDAGSVLIEWLDSDYKQQTSVVALNGQTPVAFALGVGLRVNKCRAIGSITPTTGDVYISRENNHTAGVPNNTASILSAFKATSQTSNLAAFTVPADKTLFGVTGYFSAPKGRDNDFYWNVRNPTLGIPPTRTNVVSVYQSTIEVDFALTAIPEKTDAYFSANTQTSSGRVSCRVVGVLVDNEYL